LADEWKESIIAPIYKKDDKTDCRNYTDIPLFSSTYKLLSSVLLSRLNPYAEKLLGVISVDLDAAGKQTDQTFCICQIFQKKWEYNEAVPQLFTNFMKAYYSVRREVLFNILNEFGIPTQLVKLIKLCLHETSSTVQVGKHWSDMFPFKNGWKPRRSIAILFIVALRYAITRDQVNQDDLKLNGTHKFLVYADDVKYWNEAYVCIRSFSCC